jgi:hypothetical protein
VSECQCDARDQVISGLHAIRVSVAPRGRTTGPRTPVKTKIIFLLGTNGRAEGPEAERGFKRGMYYRHGR